jgi:hypothetical protein
MTNSTAHPTKTRLLDRPWARFILHFGEMVLAMTAGMLLLMPLWDLLAGPLGATAERADVDALAMATTMTIGMTAWMRVRGHRWPPIVEMAAAMFLPYAVFLVPYWLGALPADAVEAGGHLLMLPAMLVAMLLRRDEYSRPHHRKRVSAS